MSGPDQNAARLRRHDTMVQALLRDPLALATPPQTRSLLQTAISSLIVAGDRVLKLRKPLKHEFLDFSTPALRRADCLEELRLNRRTAPALYVDVVPITGSAARPRLDGSGRIVDWALRMHRFDDTQRLDRLADRGLLSAPLIDALAGEIAQLHGSTPPSPPAFGRPESVRHWALENFDALLSGPAAHSHGPRLRDLRAWTLREFDRIAPRLAERHRAGFVREGHGDLHLGNLVLFQGRPLLFDCLEFNPALRHIDVMADLAFLFMDLQRHGLRDWAWRLVSAWAEHSGDYGSLAVLRFFAVYRAMVRAKVALLRAAQRDEQAFAAFARDLTLAEALSAAPGPARLILTCGVSGSGKSTVAQLLVEALGAVRIRSDVERKRLFGLPAAARPAAEQRASLYGAPATRRTYERLAALASALLEAGVSAIVDAASLQRGERQRLRDLAVRHGARLSLIECSAPLPTLRRRVRQRQLADDDASDADLAVLDRQLATLEPVGDDEHPCRIDTDCDLHALRRAALACVG